MVTRCSRSVSSGSPWLSRPVFLSCPATFVFDFFASCKSGCSERCTYAPVMLTTNGGAHTPTAAAHPAPEFTSTPASLGARAPAARSSTNPSHYLGKCCDRSDSGGSGDITTWIHESGRSDVRELATERCSSVAVHPSCPGVSHPLRSWFSMPMDGDHSAAALQ